MSESGASQDRNIVGWVTHSSDLALFFVPLGHRALDGQKRPRSVELNDVLELLHLRGPNPFIHDMRGGLLVIAPQDAIDDPSWGIRANESLVYHPNPASEHVQIALYGGADRRADGHQMLELWEGEEQ